MRNHPLFEELGPIVAGGPGRDDLLLKPVEVRHMLYNEVPGNFTDFRRLADHRYVNVIRSKMTRPDPTQKLNLASPTKRDYSEVCA